MPHQTLQSHVQAGGGGLRLTTHIKGSFAGTLGDLKDGKVDALLGSAMVFALGTQANYRDIGDLSSYRMPIAGSGIMVDKAWMARNRDTVLRFLKAATEATA